MSGYSDFLLTTLINEMRVANWLAAETMVNTRLHPTALHDDLVREKINMAREALSER